MSDQVVPVPVSELDGEEGWLRATDEPDLRLVEATLDEDGMWSVSVSVMEFVREEPLEGEYRQRIAAALRGVGGVDEVWEEDREVWGVTGTPSGQEVVRGVAAVVDDLAERGRPYTMG